MDRLEEFIASRRITEVEAMVPDMSGIPRGKILPAEKFLRINRERGIGIPESVFIQTVTGDCPEEDPVTGDAVGDCMMVPDPDTIRLVPWYEEPTAQVICDAVDPAGNPVDFSPRYILRHVLKLYRERGWEPVVAPELEFFLVATNRDPDYPLEPPVGRSGREESGRQAYGIDAVNEFDPVFEDVYDFCEAQEIDIDVLTHEAGAAQIEINFNHGEPLSVADQAFLFKRTVRQAALKHGIYATFMAKPMQFQPGSAMHIHQSVLDIKTGQNLFATAKGRDTALFAHHIGGLQKYLPSIMPLLAPNVNSYRRLVAGDVAPINVHWGHDNRTTGLRVPNSLSENRRVENRIAGADANPYLAIAASLACGWLGMTKRRKPSRPVEGSAYRFAYRLPRHQFDALERFGRDKDVREVLGDRFVQAVLAVKHAEIEAWQQVISSWEREYLLLNV